MPITACIKEYNCHYLIKGISTADEFKFQGSLDNNVSIIIRHLIKPVDYYILYADIMLLFSTVKYKFFP